MKKTTAIDWLIQEINKLTGTTIQIDEPCIQEAKKIEKEQIIESWCNGRFGWDCKSNDPVDYYNNNY